MQRRPPSPRGSRRREKCDFRAQQTACQKALVRKVFAEEERVWVEWPQVDRSRLHSGGRPGEEVYGGDPGRG